MGKYKIADIIFDFNFKSEIMNERLTKYQISDSIIANYSISTIYVDEIYLEKFEIIKEFNNRILCSTEICKKVFVLKNIKNQIVMKVEYYDRDTKVIAYFKKDVEDLEIKEYNLISMLVNEVFLENNLLVIHGSAIAIDNSGIIFSAPSGTGKSTQANLWKTEFQDRVTIINDDKPIIKVIDDNAYVIGSPWSGKTSLNTNCEVPLKAVVFIKQSKHNEIFSLNSKEMLKEIIKNFIRSDNLDKNDNIIANINKLSKIIKFYRLECDVSKEAVKVVYNKIIGENYEN